MKITASLQIQKHHAAAFTKFILFSFIVLLVVGCATPVGISPVDFQTG
jgi:hypothetical protein